MPTYVLPTLNLTVNVWRNGNPTTNPPDAVTKGNLTLGRRVFSGPDAGLSVGIDSMFRYLLLSSTADVRGKYQASGSDTVEVPAGSQRLYTVQDIEFVGSGFPNEHQQALLIPISPLPFTPPGPAADFVSAAQGDSATPASITVPAWSKINVAVVFQGTASTTGPLTVMSAVAGTLTAVLTQVCDAAGHRSGTMSVFVWTNGNTADSLSVSTAGADLFVVEVWQVEGSGVDATIQQTAASPPSLTTTLAGPTTHAGEAVMIVAGYWDAVAAAPSWSSPWDDFSVGPSLNGPVSTDTFGVYVGWITQLLVGTPANTVTFGGPPPDEAGTQMIAFLP